QIDVAQLLKNLYVANEEECLSHSDLTETEKNALIKHYEDLRSEMSSDVKQLSERSKIKNLETTKAGMERKLQNMQEENRAMEKRFADEKHSVDLLTAEGKEIRAEIRSLESQDQKSDKGILDNIQKLVLKNEELKKAEIAFKDQCRQEMARIQQEIKEAEQITPEDDIRESLHVLEKEREKLQTIRLQLAKKNRAIVSIQRQLDNIPSRTELAQYQRRFLELYNQVSAKHRETKQFYTMYNTLDDTKRYLTKELSLLSSIHENYTDGMGNPQSKEHFVTQLEAIVDGVQQTKTKLKSTFEDEKAKRDGLNSQLGYSLSHIKIYLEQEFNYIKVILN
ncbi:Coiled-coil domain-containing protein 93, partial [Pseudolycoriella hygida]